MKKEKNTTFIPPSGDFPTSAPAKAAKRTPSKVSEAGASKPARAKAAKKAPARRVVSPLPDSALDEVLDEALPREVDENTLEELPVDEPEEVAPTQKSTARQKRQRQKQQNEEAQLSASELICRRSGLSEDDVSMIFALGYENELGRLVGYENLKRLKAEHQKKISKHENRHYRTAFGYRGEELYGAKNSQAILAAYIYDRRKLVLRLLLTALLCVAALITDMPLLFGGAIATVSTQYPLLFPLGSILFLVLGGLLSHRQINAGLRSFLKFSPTPYSIPALLLPTAILYGLASLLISGSVLPASFLVLCSFLVLAICDTLRIFCEMRALRVLSEEGEKNVLVEATPRKKKLRRGDKIVKIVNDDIGDVRYQVRKASQTVGFFRRFNSMESAARPFAILIVLMYTTAILLGFTAAVYTSSVATAFSTFMTVLLMTAPIGACFAFFYPLFRANRLLSRRGCALLGDEAVTDYDCKKTVLFRDTELYAIEKYTRIAVREGNDFRNDLRLAGMLFARLGGTLTAIGTELEDPLAVSIVRVQDSGVEAMIENKHHVLAGNADYMTACGIRIPKESSDRTLGRAPEVALLYVAIDGALKLGYEIEYRTSQEFEELVSDLAGTDTEVAITGFDPNLHETFLRKSRGEGREPVHASRAGRFEEESVLEIADTGAVSVGDSLNIAYPLYAASAIGILRRFAMRIQAVASIVGAFAVILLVLLGEGQPFGIFPILVYQLFWVLVSVIASHSELNAEKLHLKKK